MGNVYLDFETFSEIDLKLVGAYKYSEHLSTEILLVGFAIDDQPTIVVEPHDPLINELLNAIKNEAVIIAHNIGFEFPIWNNVGVKKYGWKPIPIPQFRCTAARARAMALPNSLEHLAIALDLPILKDKAGDALIAKYSKLDRKGNRHYLHENPDDMVAFKNYCGRDVDVEKQIDQIIPHLSPYELDVFHHDMLVNQRGIPLDVDCLHKSQQIIGELEQHFENESLKIAGFKATQRNKVLEWLETKNVKLPNLLVETVELALQNPNIDDEVKTFLELRYESSRVGTKKSKKMLEMMCDNGSIKGSLLYHSATTGRWGSRGVQFQNMARPDSKEQQSNVINIIKNGTADDLLKQYPRPLSAISKSMRGFVKANDGHRFLVADFSNIEARVLAWLADEQSLMNTYKAKGDVYKQMASKIYNVEISNVTPAQRRIGKITILGAGYGMGHKKFHIDCETNQLGITLDEAKNIIDLYRENVPNIVKFWEQANKAAILAVAHNKTITINKCKFYVEGKFLHIELPSTRKLAFYEPRLVVNQWDKPQIEFTEFFNGKKTPKTLYGGLIVQNISQATARDMLVNGMMTAEKNGYPVHFHVHDECIAMLPNHIGSIGDFMEQLTTVPCWAPNFPLESEGYESDRFQK